MASATHSLFYTFEISGGNEVQLLSVIVYVSVKAERPEPVQPTQRPTAQSKQEEGKKER
jgi:hypothetical protein